MADEVAQTDATAHATQPGRRGKLDRRVIVNAVLQLAKDEPHTRITFKRLGSALGVDATAMYRHFRNKDELISAALDRLVGLAAEVGRNSEGTWRQRLEAQLMRTAELALEYPSVAAEAQVLDPGGQGDADSIEFLLEMLTESGLADEALLQAYAAIEGFAVAQSSALANDVLKQAGAARDGSIPWNQPLEAMNLQHHPITREHRDALVALDGMTVYRAGIAALLDAVELGRRD